MITNKTVLVLGAGASNHAKLPTGNELARFISEDLRKKGPIKKLLIVMGHKRHECNALVTLLTSSHVDTPDFILANSPLQEIGKRAIALAVGLHENWDTLMNANSERKGWYQYLWNRMYSHRIEDFSSNNIRIITFNYDRSFEAYFLEQIRQSYGLSIEKAQELYDQAIQVVHVHGAIGKYDITSDDGARPYEAKWYDPQLSNYRDLLIATTDSIELATQASVDSDHFKCAQSWLRESLYVIFIGCAYHELNMANLKIEETLDKHKYIFASTYGLEMAEIKTRLQFLRKLKGRDNKPWYPDATPSEIVIGNQAHKATPFLRHSVWFDSLAHEAAFIARIMMRDLT